MHFGCNAAVAGAEPILDCPGPNDRPNPGDHGVGAHAALRFWTSLCVLPTPLSTDRGCREAVSSTRVQRGRTLLNSAAPLSLQKGGRGEAMPNVFAPDSQIVSASALMFG